MLIFTQFREMTEPLAGFLGSLFHRPGLVLHGETAVMSGALYVSDEWKAMDIQGIQGDLARLYRQAAGA